MNRALSLLQREKRFLAHRALVKHESKLPGPGEYDILAHMDRQRIKPCMRFVKPELVDENVFEVVGGTSKVLKTSLMTPKQQRTHESRISHFLSRTPAAVQSRRKVNDTMIFLKKDIKSLQPATHAQPNHSTHSSD